MTNTIPLIDINVQPIELCKLLKIANMVGGGGEAKIVISEGYVLVNNEVEFQKRKKVYHDDIIEFNGELVQVNATKNRSAQEKNKKPKVKNTANKQQAPQQQSQSNPAISSEQPRSKRKPISF